jgi:hypothetical protein
MLFQENENESIEQIDYNKFNGSVAIKRIDFSYGNVRTLPILPTELEELWADENEELTELPQKWPSKMRTLSLCATGIRTLDLMWPCTLKQLYISDNPGIILPIFPPKLEIFSGNSCNFYSLPVFPSTLLHISVSNNNIKTLPQLPPNLEYLNVENNLIVRFPAIPNTVHTLICCGNRVETFVNISTQLKTFYCSNNCIQRFPELPLGLVTQPNSRSNFIYCGNPLIYEFTPQYSLVTLINKVNHFVEFYYSVIIACKWKKYLLQRKEREQQPEQESITISVTDNENNNSEISPIWKETEQTLPLNKLSFSQSLSVEELLVFAHKLDESSKEKATDMLEFNYDMDDWDMVSI